MQNEANTSFVELRRWVNDTNEGLRKGIERQPFLKLVVIQVTGMIKQVAKEIRVEYPFHASELEYIANQLFFERNGWSYLNTCIFGGLFYIVRQVSHEEQNELWRNVHPRIIKVSQSLYADGYYDSAADKALREVETYMRELYAVLKPGKGDPKEINTIKEALLSDNSIYAFDHSTMNGENYYKGIKSLFDNAFLAYRNPASHRNADISRRQAFERIVLASQLMYVLDERK